MVPVWYWCGYARARLASRFSPAVRAFVAACAVPVWCWCGASVVLPGALSCAAGFGMRGAGAYQCGTSMVLVWPRKGAPGLPFLSWLCGLSPRVGAVPAWRWCGTSVVLLGALS